MKIMILSTGRGSNPSDVMRALDFVGSLIGWQDSRDCFSVGIGSTAVSPIAIKFGSIQGILAYNSVLIASSVLGETTGIEEGAK